jgi:hypothetical protein
MELWAIGTGDRHRRRAQVISERKTYQGSPGSRLVSYWHKVRLSCPNSHSRGGNQQAIEGKAQAAVDARRRR